MCNIYPRRYDDVWTDWRTTSGGDAYKEEETLELATREDITSISGCSWDDNGFALSLQAETSAGRQWGPFGNHNDASVISLRSSSPTSSGLRLHHLSGDQTMDNRILRWLEF